MTWKSAPTPSLLFTSVPVDLAVVGAGLIGSSIAISAQRLDRSVVVWDVSPPVRDAARKMGLEITETLADAVEQAPLVVIAVSLGNNNRVIARAAKRCAPGTVITDVASVKKPLGRLFDEMFDHSSISYVSGHPMAGKAHRGIENADGDLFRDCTWILCDAPESPPVDIVKDFALELGAQRVLHRTAVQHNAQVAAISHFPQLLVSAVACQHRPEDLTPAVMKALRLATSPSGMWSEIVRENEVCIEGVVTQARKVLSKSGLVPDDEEGDRLRAMSSLIYSTARVLDEKMPGTLELAGPGFRDSTSLNEDRESMACTRRARDFLGACLDEVAQMLDDKNHLESCFHWAKSAVTT